MPWWYKFYQLRDENKDGSEGGGGSGSSEDDGNGEAGGEVDPPEGEKGESSEGSGDPKLDALDPKIQSYIKKLRGEAGKYRQEAKVSKEKFGKVKGVLVELGLATPDDEDPQETIKSLTNLNDENAFRNGILEAALEHGISKDGLDYFNFLVEKKAKSLGDDEQIDDEALAEIALEAKAKTGGAPNKSGVGGGTGGKPPPSGGSKTVPVGDLTAEKFAVMSNTEQTALYNKNPDVFTRLAKEARTKRLLTRG